MLAFAASPRVRARPHSLYRTLRAVDPVHKSPFGIWLLTRHADVSSVLRSPVVSNTEANVDMDSLNLEGLNRIVSRLAFGQHDMEAAREHKFFELMGSTMLFRDPPDHTRLRALVNKAFTPKRAEALAPVVESVLEEILGPIQPRSRMELMGELAYPLPARIICELFGVPREDQAFIVGLAPALAVGLDPGPMRSAESVRAAEKAAEELSSYLSALIEARRRQPGPDLLSALVTAEENGEVLSQLELLSTTFLLLVAGHETTANLI
ncbi:MAG TPA: hypothetical protein VGR90_07045, partial [Acidimicrobiales bacterium]|nr:hypothetical protein [Acidimicrobiales bacterium]